MKDYRLLFVKFNILHPIDMYKRRRAERMSVIEQYRIVSAIQREINAHKEQYKELVRLSLQPPKQSKEK